MKIEPKGRYPWAKESTIPWDRDPLPIPEGLGGKTLEQSLRGVRARRPTEADDEAISRSEIASSFLGRTRKDFAHTPLDDIDFQLLD